MPLSKQQLIKNSAWTFLELSLYPVLMIVATPVFIHKLGIEQYGLWMLVTNMMLGINMLNIGVGDTNIRLISGHRAQNNPAAIRHTVHYNFSLSLLLCFLAAVLGIIFYATDLIGVFYKKPDHELANKILFLACVCSGIKFIEIGLLSVFKAFERFDVNSKLNLLSKNSAMIINLILVSLNYDLLAVFTSTLIVGILNIFIQMRVLHVFDRGILSWPSFIFLKERLHAVNYNFWYWLQSTIGLLGYLSDKLVIAYFTDVRTLGYYSVASLIGTQIHNCFMAFGTFIFPNVSFKLSSNQSVRPIYFLSRAMVALPGWLITATLIIGGDFVFKLWLGEDTYLNSIGYIRLYLAYISLLLLNIIPLYFINGTPHIRLNSLFEVLLRGSHIAFMICGYLLAGIHGILYGLILSTALNLPIQYTFFHKYVIGGIPAMQAFTLLIPALLIVGLAISGNVIFTLSLILALIVSCKLIYFDPAKQYSASNALFTSLFARRQAK